MAEAIFIVQAAPIVFGGEGVRGVDKRAQCGVFLELPGENVLAGEVERPGLSVGSACSSKPGLSSRMRCADQLVGPGTVPP